MQDITNKQKPKTGISKQATEKLQIKIMPPTVPENDSDRALFTLFDFLLTDNTHHVEEKNLPVKEKGTEYKLVDMFSQEKRTGQIIKKP